MKVKVVKVKLSLCLTKHHTMKTVFGGTHKKVLGDTGPI